MYSRDLKPLLYEMEENPKHEYLCGPQIWSPWQISGWTSLTSSRSVTCCWLEDAGTFRINITTLFTTWWFKEAASVMGTPASVRLEEGGERFPPSLGWYGPETIYRAVHHGKRSSSYTALFCSFRFTENVFVSTKQLEKTVRDVRTFTMTPPGGLGERRQQTSAEVNQTGMKFVSFSCFIYI